MILRQKNKVHDNILYLDWIAKIRLNVIQSVKTFANKC